jgi:hypothetical protein
MATRTFLLPLCLSIAAFAAVSDVAIVVPALTAAPAMAAVMNGHTFPSRCKWSAKPLAHHPARVARLHSD